MAGVGGFFGKFFGRTIGDAASFAIGGAVERTIEPELQVVANESWRATVAAGVRVPLDADQAAEIVAEAVELEAWGADQAAQTGIGHEQFAALVQAVLNAPGSSELLTLWRRGLISSEQFDHGLRKARLEPVWDKALRKAKDQPIAPAVAALAAVRGLIDDEGTLLVSPPTGGGKVPAYPQLPISGKDAAAAAGLSEDAYAVMVGINGRPMSLHEAASAYFRQIIELNDYYRAVSEGDTRNEWRDAILEQARQIPSATDFVQAHLRGWTDEPGMNAGAARHGMSADDVHTLFLIHGRPLSWHQVWIGLQRGGKYDGPVDELDPAFLKSLRESDIRPEWYNLAWAQRYNYPTAFVLRTLTTDGDISGAEAEQILLYEGWEPGLAHKVAMKWAGGSGKAATVPEVKSARTRLLTTLHSGYVKQGATDASVIAALEAESYPASTIDGLLRVWSNERAFLRAQAATPPSPVT